MSFESSPAGHEIMPELEFINFDTINALRTSQDAAIREAELYVIAEGGLERIFGNRELRAEARESVIATFDGQIESFITSQFDRDTDPVRHAALAGLVQQFSVDKMSQTKWANGDQDADGHYDYKTSGRYQLQEALKTISNPHFGHDHDAHPHDEQDHDDEDEDFVDHTSPEVQAAYVALQAITADLAKLSIERRRLLRRSSGKVPAKLEAQYNAAHAAHQAAMKTTIDLFVAGGRAKGVSEQTIYEKCLPKMIFHGYHQLTKAEFEQLKSNDSLRARAARFLARRGAMLGISAGAGLAIGAGARALSKSALMAGAGISGGALIGATLAARTTKNVLTAKVRNDVLLNKEFSKREAADHQAVAKFQAETSGDHDAEAALYAISAKIGDTVTKRVETDVRNNKRRMIIAGTVGAVAAGAAFYGPDLYHDIVGDKATKAIDTVTTLPSTPSAPTTIVPLSGASSPEFIDGFNPQQYVDAGHGFIAENKDLFASRGIHLTDLQSTRAYDAYRQAFGAANPFASGPSTYVQNGDFRISSPGAAVYNRQYLDFMNQWYHDHADEFATAS